jgi:hypothetical protein
MADRAGFWQRVLGWFSRATAVLRRASLRRSSRSTPDSIDADLQRLYEIVQRKANDSIPWYVADRLSKKRAAWWIRLGAILFVSLAGLVPVLDAAGLIDEQPTVVAVVAEGDPGSVDLRRVEQRLNRPAVPSLVPSSGSSATSSPRSRRHW